jgi:soluble lytic murein transglycosylase
MTAFPRSLVYTLALVGAAASLPSPARASATGPGDSRGEPRTIRAVRVASRVARADAARLHYLDAAATAPEVAEWLLLRAAALSRDSLERAELYARIRTSVVRARILATEARAREEAGDLVGAAFRYDSLGQFSDGVRLRLHLASTPEQRAALRNSLVAVIRQQPGRPETLRAIELLGQISVVLTPQEALEVARLATQAGAVTAAVPLYARAVAGRIAGQADLLAYGSALAATRRHREAIKVFTRLRADTLFGVEAAYGEAWSLARTGQTARARSGLEQLLNRSPQDTLVRPRALFLSGDLAWQSGDQKLARNRWTELLQRFPKADSAARGGFLAALTLYEEGKTTEAAQQWEQVHLINARNDGLAAGYWAARAWSEAGNPARATGLWQSVIARDSTSYYALLSARRLKIAMWRPEAAREQFAHYADVDSAMDRLRDLRSLGMDEEAAFEVSWVIAGGTQSSERALAIADALRRTGEPAAAVAAARSALAVGAASDARTYRLLFPKHFDAHLETHATEAGLDPLLVAALIRQESNWNDRARSRVGALGLMQVMPATGRLIARSLRVRGWRPDQLYEPAMNLRFGTWYLGQSLRQYGGDIPRALAAYNAGGTRIRAWATGAAATDSELFVERINLRETRDYVRIIQRNLAMYRALYGSGG